MGIATIVFLCACGAFATAKYIDGTLESDENWAFLTRFCFRTEGSYHYHFTYSSERCCQNILMYFDTVTQWDAVYESNLNCSAREAVLEEGRNQKIILSPHARYSGCSIVSSNGTREISCRSVRSFKLSRARWWYIAVSKCDGIQNGLRLDYQMHMFNPGGYWTNEFSADEQGILETDIAFLIAFILLFLLAGIQGSTLYQIGRLHMTFKLFIGTIVLQIASLVFLCIHYGVYGKNGVGVPTLIPIGRIIAAVNEILFLLLLMLLAKGWTVVRGRLTEESQLRLVALMVIYTIAYAIMFIWEAKAFDPAKVIYVYDSPAGYGIVALSFIAFCWFVYAVIVTAKKNPDKQRFYVQFCSVYSFWLLSRFIVVMVSNSYLEDWYREKVVNGINLAVAFAADVAFMIFTRPYGNNFPFHLKPSQISVDLSESSDPEHPYAPSSPVSGDRSIELFQGKAPFSRSSSENREGAPKTDRKIQAWSGHVPTHLFRSTHAQQDSRL